MNKKLIKFNLLLFFFSPYTLCTKDTITPLFGGTPIFVSTAVNNTGQAITTWVEENPTTNWTNQNFLPIVASLYDTTEKKWGTPISVIGQDETLGAAKNANNEIRCDINNNGDTIVAWLSKDSSNNSVIKAARALSYGNWQLLPDSSSQNIKVRSFISFVRNREPSSLEPIYFVFSSTGSTENSSNKTNLDYKYYDINTQSWSNLLEVSNNINYYVIKKSDNGTIGISYFFPRSDSSNLIAKQIPQNSTLLTKPNFSTITITNEQVTSNTIDVNNDNNMIAGWTELENNITTFHASHYNASPGEQNWSSPYIFKTTNNTSLPNITCSLNNFDEGMVLGSQENNNSDGNFYSTFYINNDSYKGFQLATENNPPQINTQQLTSLGIDSTTVPSIALYSPINTNNTTIRFLTKTPSESPYSWENSARLSPYFLAKSTSKESFSVYATASHKASGNTVIITLDENNILHTINENFKDLFIGTIPNNLTGIPLRTNYPFQSECLTQLTWDPPTITNGLTEYIISLNNNQLATVPPNQLSFTVNNLIPNTLNTFEVTTIYNTIPRGGSKISTENCQR